MASKEKQIINNAIKDLYNLIKKLRLEDKISGYMFCVQNYNVEKLEEYINVLEKSLMIAFPYNSAYRKHLLDRARKELENDK